MFQQAHVFAFAAGYRGIHDIHDVPQQKVESLTHTFLSTRLVTLADVHTHSDHHTQNDLYSQSNTHGPIFTRLLEVITQENEDSLVLIYCCTKYTNAPLSFIRKTQQHKDMNRQKCYYKPG